eukprot:m.21119 g.21119  ORF g.21119 m.21119 type:complete len:659 (+) comp7040_c0_seq1:272-2248(+)
MMVNTGKPQVWPPASGTFFRNVNTNTGSLATPCVESRPPAGASSLREQHVNTLVGNVRLKEVGQSAMAQSAKLTTMGGNIGAKPKRADPTVLDAASALAALCGEPKSPTVPKTVVQRSPTEVRSSLSHHISTSRHAPPTPTLQPPQSKRGMRAHSTQPKQTRDDTHEQSPSPVHSRSKSAPPRTPPGAQLVPPSQLPAATGPPRGLQPGCIRVTTFQTRSRDETRALQAEAETLNRRYIPPGRPVFQSFIAPDEPPTSPSQAEAVDIFPFVRIGDTIELNFAMSTPFEQMCQGFQMEPGGQTALGFATMNLEGTAHRTLEFEIYYYHCDEGILCLRCQESPAACTCKYASDLLEINRDWKTKRDPQRRLGLKQHLDGTASIALRIPRNRRKLTPAEIKAGMTQSDRPNTWNSKLRQRSPKDAKVICLRIVERLRPLDEKLPVTVLAEHHAFARLVAKNGGQPHANNSRRKQKASQQRARRSPSSDAAPVREERVPISPPNPTAIRKRPPPDNEAETSPRVRMRIGAKSPEITLPVLSLSAGKLKPPGSGKQPMAKFPSAKNITTPRVLELGQTQIQQQQPSLQNQLQSVQQCLTKIHNDKGEPQTPPNPDQVLQSQPAKNAEPLDETPTVVSRRNRAKRKLRWLTASDAEKQLTPPSA